MRRFLGLSILALIVMTSAVGCDSYAARKSESEATAATKLTRATSTAATAK